MVSFKTNFMIPVCLQSVNVETKYNRLVACHKNNAHSKDTETRQHNLLEDKTY